MPDQQHEQTFAPHDAAVRVGITPASIRRWCEYHAAHLSDSARPLSGVQRRLTGKDIEVLRHVKSLRDQGLTVPIINEQLQGLSFAEIDNQVDSDVYTVSPTDAPASPQQVQAMLAVLETVNAVQRRLEAVEAVGKANRRDSVQWFAFGFIVAAFMFLGMVVLSWLYGGR